MPSRRPILRVLLPILALLLVDGAILGAGWALAQTVVPAWKKGPLIDPASPYAPENAYLLGAVALAAALDLYLLGLALFYYSRRFASEAQIFASSRRAAGARANRARGNAGGCLPPRVSGACGGLTAPQGIPPPQKKGSAADAITLGCGRSPALWRRWLRPRWWAPWLALIAAVAVTEAGLRAYLSVTMLTYFRPHPSLYWEVRPNLHGFVNRTGGDTVLDTNADGMRGVTVPRQKPPGEFRVLVLGDSSNFGHGVEGDEVWSAVLQDLLRQRLPDARLTVLNGACPGWTTYEGLRFLEATGFAYHPDLVIAGFNNDPGPDYLGDQERRSPPWLQAIHGMLFRSEAYLVAREVVLSTLRRFVPAPDAPYTARSAGSAPVYGKLGEDDAARLVPRVPLPDFLDNLTALHSASEAHGAHFAWIDMPINRVQPELVDRYVDPAYRAEARILAARVGFPVIEVDTAWEQAAEPGMHLQGHVFHPSPQGHRRLARQVTDKLLTLGWLPSKP